MSSSLNEVTRIQLGESHIIAVMAHDSSGVGVTGATVNLRVRRASDGFFFTGTTFQSGVATVSMTEFDSTNLPGLYTYQFPAAAISQAATLLYVATCTTAGVTNEPWYGQIKVGGWVDYVNYDLETIGAAAIFIPALLGTTNTIRTMLTVVDDGIKGIFRVVQDIVARLGQILLRMP